MKLKEFATLLEESQLLVIHLLQSQEDMLSKDECIVLSELNLLHKKYVKEIDNFKLYPKFEFSLIPIHQQEIQTFCNSHSIKCKIFLFRERYELDDCIYPVTYIFKGFDITDLIAI